MKLRFAGHVAAAVLINTLTVAGLLQEAPKKQTNARKAKKARLKRQITWM
jgi:uridylate kinase